MKAAEVHELVERLATLDDACADRAVLAARLADTERLTSWAESRRLVLASLMAGCASFPEDAIGAATRRSHREAARTLERSQVAEEVPALAEALADGAVAGSHLDALGDGLRRLEPHQRAEVDTDRLAHVARHTTPDEFRRAVAQEVQRVQTDVGMDRLEQQRRNTRLRSWTGRDGMVHLAGQFDPETGLTLLGRLRNEVERRFVEHTPDTCPSDPFEKQDHLRALALVSLTEGNGPRSSLPEIIGVRDERCSGCPICSPSQPVAEHDAPAAPSDDLGIATPPSDAAPTRRQPQERDDAPPRRSREATAVIDWGVDVTLPAPVVDAIAARARHTEVVVRDGIVVSPTKGLRQGRTTRLANQMQRRVLRALYPTCAVPGCQVRFPSTDIHHVVWWEHGGATDLDNLLPLCSKHHHAVHDGGWQLALLPDRTLHVAFPDGTRTTTGPPSRAAP
jgi:hypothetical protein